MGDVDLTADTNKIMNPVWMQRGRRIALINPTKFLGNLLLSGQHIQHLVSYCADEGIELLLVLDSGFRELFEPAFQAPGVHFVYYPRQLLKARRQRLKAARAWLACVRSIRRFQADLAFTIEEDSVSHRLAHLSAARFRVSSTEARYQFGFHKYLQVERANRAAGERSIWFAYREIFSKLALPVPRDKAYPVLSSVTAQVPDLKSGQCDRPLFIIHAGASKHYKIWPVASFIELALRVIERGYHVVLIGAGAGDAALNRAVLAGLGESYRQCTDLCDRLDLKSLAELFAAAAFIVGNDSGPSHLASALGLPGVVIFGPTIEAIWRPLGPQTRVIQHRHVCLSDCTRHHCRQAYACLSTIQTDEVLESVPEVNAAVESAAVSSVSGNRSHGVRIK
ncbi:MAG: hypothetical protein CMQ46_12305 [Gammaproteobacteria bacterium]|nr:hypothetical protein [Gammaproteobacteria bacterium]MBJ55974.1 hypothetical protein [Gammaproteobacteria bacterium]MBJ56031.1 hypothetical protein [Gammaproteobacteria bacterium]